MPFPAKTSTDAIIQSAADLIRTDGLASLSMRTLAARLGVRASSLYRHFPDRLAIEQTLAHRASDELLLSMQQSAEGLTGERALYAAARAYLEYATSEQSFYDLLMQSGVSPVTKPEKARQLLDYFVGLVSSTTQFANDMSGAAALWSFLHGFAALSRLGMLGEGASRLTFARGAQALVRGLSVAETELARSQTQG